MTRKTPKRTNYSW